MKQRFRLGKAHASIQEDIDAIIEGNDRASYVVGQLFVKEGNFAYFRLLDLDDMNIRGLQVQLAYENFCNYEIDKFITAVTGRDEKLVNYLNTTIYNEEPWLAVQHGASFDPVYPMRLQFADKIPVLKSGRPYVRTA